MTGNLSSSEIQNVAAITISTSISGPVILDLKGFTLTGGGGDSIAIGIGFFAGTNVSNTSPVTIRNGTLANFAFGVWAEGLNFAILSDITVNNMTINLGHSQSAGAGVLFSAVVSSTISNCSFHGGSYDEPKRWDSCCAQSLPIRWTASELGGRCLSWLNGKKVIPRSL